MEHEPMHIQLVGIFRVFPLFWSRLMSEGFIIPSVVTVIGGQQDMVLMRLCLFIEILNYLILLVINR
eukprot:UN19727